MSTTGRELKRLRLGTMPNGKPSMPMLNEEELRGVLEVTLKVSPREVPTATILLRLERVEFDGQVDATITTACPCCGAEKVQP